MEFSSVILTRDLASKSTDIRARKVLGGDGLLDIHALALWGLCTTPDLRMFLCCARTEGSNVQCPLCTSILCNINWQFVLELNHSEWLTHEQF